MRPGPILTLRDVLAATAGEPRGSASPELRLSSVCVDSRRAGPGALFVALRGPVRDGHAFVADAFARGAAAALVERIPTSDVLAEVREGPPLVVVPSTPAALQALAGYWQDRRRAAVVAVIRGSIGKATIKLHGRLPEGTTATDLVLIVTEMLRKKGVVGNFVEFYGTGLSSLSLPDRATIANMAPEYGATMGFFPVDAETLSYLRFTGRTPERVRLVEEYTKAQGYLRTDATPDPSIPTSWNSISPRWKRPLRDRNGRRTACLCGNRRLRSKSRWKEPHRSTLPFETTATNSNFPTARWLSPRSRVAPIRRTRPSCWAPAYWRKRPLNVACTANPG